MACLKAFFFSFLFIITLSPVVAAEGDPVPTFVNEMSDWVRPINSTYSELSSIELSSIREDTNDEVKDPGLFRIDQPCGIAVDENSVPTLVNVAPLVNDAQDPELSRISQPCSALRRPWKEDPVLCCVFVGGVTMITINAILQKYGIW